MLEMRHRGKIKITRKALFGCLTDYGSSSSWPAKKWNRRLETVVLICDILDSLKRCYNSYTL